MKITTRKPGRSRCRRRAALTEGQRRLAESYLPLARGLAKGLKEAYPAAWEDFESAACLALVESAATYDPGRNVRFATFASIRIRGALRDVQREQVPRGWRVDRVGEAPNVCQMPDDAEEVGRVLTGGKVPAVGAEMEQREAVEDWLRTLPRRHAAACRLIYLDDCTYDEAALVLGCSQSRVAVLHQQAMMMLGLRARDGRHVPDRMATNPRIERRSDANPRTRRQGAGTCSS